MYRKWTRKYIKGFTIIEILFSLSISLIILLNCSLFFKVLKTNNLQNNFDSSIENGIQTLSYELLTSHQLTYGSELTFYNEKDEKMTVKLDKEQLVITPGYNVICHDLQAVDFYNENGLIYIHYSYNNQDFTYMIGSDYENKEEG